MVQNIAIQIGMAAATAIGRQLTRAERPRHPTKDDDKQAASSGTNGDFDYGVNDELAPQPPTTPIKFISEPRLDMEVFRMDDTGGEMNSAGSLDVDGTDCVDTSPCPSGIHLPVDIP